MGFANGNVELTVPGFLLAPADRSSGHMGLGLARMVQPGAAQQLLTAMLDDLEDDHLCGGGTRVQRAHDARG